MALTATLLKFQLDISDVDRGVYDAVELKVAQHPSETADRVVLRVLARALAHEQDLVFGRGLSTVEDPALLVPGPGDAIKLWIDVGAPAADRLHKASKRAERVMVFTERDDNALQRTFAGKIHQADQIEVVRLPRPFVEALAESFQRTQQWGITLVEGSLNVSVGEANHTAEVVRTTVAALAAS